MPQHSRTATLAAPPTGVAVPYGGEQLCGYRVIRKLGDGPRAEVYLGYGGEHDGASPTTAALKIARPSADGGVAVEMEALARAVHPHLVRLLDAATGPDGSPCLILERLARGSLAQLLERRVALGVGESITVLAPIVQAVGAMHAAGVVHNAIGVAAVLFRDSGAPVLARFGHAELIEPALVPARLAAFVADDRRALAQLVALVLARVGGAAPAAAAEWVHGAWDRDRFIEDLVDRLFALGAATPVRFAEDELAPGSAVPARVGAAGEHAVAGAGWRRRIRAFGVPNAQQLAGVVTSVRRVRTPVWVAAASVLVAAIAAAIVLPGSDDGGRAAAREPVTVTSPSAPSPSTSPSDDPVVALGSLAQARSSCIDQLSVLCLDTVDQNGSAALDDDAELVQGVRAGGELPTPAALDVSAATVTERLGDSVLVSLGDQREPASVLMIRTEAGWRIRDYLG